MFPISWLISACSETKIHSSSRYGFDRVIKDKIKTKCVMRLSNRRICPVNPV